ncbi:NHS-like protein 1 isoform X2 [Conger conger]|uniref:NHS-like protein 1 isoform X2 n=1 Tax=Conger conger TaxID=82655 RepID=UPI002A5A56AD|nr:NHS-like protein 1 isoform X2 [Conger conger]
MPFHSRSVEPRRVCRLNDVDYIAGALTDRDDCNFTGVGDYKVRKLVLFTSLEEVCCHTLTNIIHQLSDLSRHASNIFLEIEAEAGLLSKRSCRIQLRLETLQSTVRSFDHKKIKIPVSNLDEESRWTVHYTAPWHQQENVFLPGNRPPCVEDLHRQAKVNLKTALRECDKLRKDGFRSSQYYSQGPIFSSSLSNSSLQDIDDYDKKSTASSAEDDKLYPSRPLTPLMGGGQNFATPLPTPEQKMREQAQAVPTDIIPINVSAGKGPEDFRAQSMYIPGQFSTLGRVGSMNSSLRRSETRDSSCQTEEVKIVPPSVRRIRAQRGQGIAAQMASLSASSSGSISAASFDCTDARTPYAYAPQLNGGGARFHSLPRQGARVSLSSEANYSSAPYRPEDCLVGGQGQSRQIAKLQADETVVHLRNSPRTGTMPRPKSQQEVRRVQGDPAPLLVSPHAAYSTSLIPNATLSSTAQVITLHTTGHTQMDRPVGAQPLAPLRGEMGSQCSEPDAPSESSCCSDGSFQNSATSAADQWVYDTAENVLPKRPLTSSCSTPINHLYNSLERPSNCTDSGSLCSIDNDGYYTSMRLDSGLKSRSQGNISATRHSMYECQQQHYGSQDERASLYSNRSLSRSISLRKAKKPPLPPARTDSLRRKPKKTASNGAALNETLIASLQQSLQQGGLKDRVATSSPSQSPCSDYEDPWVLRPRSQSSASAGSSGVSANVYSLCPVTPPQSDTSSLRSDYVEWGCYAELPRSPLARSVSVGGTPRGSLGNGPQDPLPLPLPLPQDTPKPKAATTSSPDRVHRLTSPSSGYSSQSNTPTAGTPVPSFVRALSPAGARPKPKVPERKSSLLSSMSISSSSTSLSSNTSDSARTPVPPPSLPVLPLTPNFSPPALPQPVTPETAKSPPLYGSSPEFPSPPPEVMMDAVRPVNNVVIPPPPPPLPSSAPIVPPPLPLSPTAPPTVTPLALKSLKETLKSVTLLDVNHSPNGVKKPGLDHPGSTVPLITAQALQMVQLRSVKKPERLQSAEATTSAQETRDGNDSPNATPEVPKKPEPPTVLLLPSCATPTLNGTHKPPTPVKFLRDLPKSSIPETTPGAAASTDPPRDATPLGQAPLPSEPADDPLLSAHIDPESSPVVSPNDTVPIPAPKQKPPVTAKKPKLSLLASPPPTPPKSSAETPPKVLPQTPTPPKPTLLEEEQLHSEVALNSQNGTPSPRTAQLEGTEETDSRTSTPPTQSRESLLSELSANILQAAHDPSITPVAQELPLNSDESTSEGDGHGNADGDADIDGDRDVDADADADGDGASSTTGSVSSKDEESGEVFDSSTANSAPAASTNGDALEDMVTPTRPRTTEDLFAAIHRSKRKVLGRKESEEDRSRGHSPSPPVTPTGPSQALTSSLPRPSGPIQRSLRKSATSSDSFKALLLRKGSRTETSFRMSAAEMLRSTDPRFQRTRSESSLDPCPDSPGRGSRRAQEDWARCEGALPRPSGASSPSSSSKYGRARAPPMAASSKYNARSRILSSPMTVIREGEGELGEAADSLDLPADLAAALCGESS